MKLDRIDDPVTWAQCGDNGTLGTGAELPPQHRFMLLAVSFDLFFVSNGKIHDRFESSSFSRS